MRGSRSILAAGLALAAASLFSAGTRAEDNMRAANAPLPGDVALYAKERTCAEALETPGYFRSINAAELADAQRRGVYACATFTGAFDGANQIYAWRSQDSYQGVSFINNRKPGELYLTGGDLPKLSGPVAPGPFVAKADAATGKEILAHLSRQRQCVGPLDRGPQSQHPAERQRPHRLVGPCRHPRRRYGPHHRRADAAARPGGEQL